MSRPPRTSLPDSWHPLLLANKALLLGAAFFALWLTHTNIWGEPGIVVISYLALTVFYLVMLDRIPRHATGLHIFGYGLDLGLVLYLLTISGGLSSPLWPLLILEVLLPALYLPWSLLIWFGAFAIGPLYVLTLWLHSSSLAFLTDPLFLIRYSMLFLGAIVTALAAQHLQQTRYRQQELQNTLATREADLDAQTQRLQRTAGDLRDRVLQLRSLQEVARALAATLDLSSTMRVLVGRMATLTDAQYAAIALLDHTGTELHGIADSNSTGDDLNNFDFTVKLEPADIELLSQGNIVSSETGDNLGFQQLQDATDMNMFLCSPLVMRGEPIGALYLADARSDFGAERQRQLLDSFSYFAAASVENAQLYQAVADKSRELETILSGIGDGVLVVDADLRLVLMNPIAVRIFALQSAPPTGVPIHNILEHEVFLGLLEEIRTASGEAMMREIELSQEANNKERIYQALATPLTVGSHLQGIATVLRDVTSQKELERMKSNFLSVVSHELKTPLHSIKGFVNIILMNKTGPVTDIQRDFLETVKQQTDHLQRLIDDLLEFSRLESGQVTLRLQPVDIPVVAEAVVDKLTPLADASDVTLINRVPESLPTISADPWRLEQVVTNLMDNAIKFTPANGRVIISAKDRGEYLEVGVQDSGIGIAPDETDRIFDRFYQVDGGANRLYKGAGLGLTICRHIVEHHGGRIWAESETREGATFRFTVSKHLQDTDIGALDFTTLPQERHNASIVS